MRMTAAKIKAGDFEYVYEGLVGQSAWLQMVAQRMVIYGEGIKDQQRKIACLIWFSRHKR